MYQGRRVAVLIVAAGKGSRMGDGPAKQYREIAGAPVLERTLRAFSSHPFIDDICIVVNKEGREFCNVLVPKAGNGKVRGLVSGGETRQESVRNGLKALEILREEGLLGEEETAKKGKKAEKEAPDLVLIQDGARPFATKDLIDRVLEGTLRTGAAVPVTPVKDTIKYGDGRLVKETLPREKLFAAQTPQGFERLRLSAAMEKARKKNFAATDDASFVEKYGRKVCMVRGDYRNIKITTAEDLPLAEYIAADLDRWQEEMAPLLLKADFVEAEHETVETLPAEDPGIIHMPGPLHEALTGEDVEPEGLFVKPEVPADEPAEPIQKEEPNPAEPGALRPRAGTGFDVHVLVPDRPLILGGVQVPYEKGLLGHSDADVLTHAAMDALLGAAGMGDIGKHFPDTDPAFKGADSIVLLRYVAKLLQRNGFAVSNLDVTLIAQAPKVAPYTAKMRRNLALALQIPEDRVNVKATTTERLGYCGRGEGMAAQATAILLQGEQEILWEEPAFEEAPAPAPMAEPVLKAEEPLPAAEETAPVTEEPAPVPEFEPKKPACFKCRKAEAVPEKPKDFPEEILAPEVRTDAGSTDTGWIELFTD
ncbi:MAG: 2-C-methyl-D-erythritol 2,4-cyclodiphosphate synthase [Clostridiales bacterium]|nr:2-C-methyl-D-erythritol 2,4-cyclodiphosphate synthase [Clostridiales bacterium]